MSLISFKFPFAFDANRLSSDAARFEASEWKPHFNIHNYYGDWSVIPLRAVAGASSPIYPDPDDAMGYFETEFMARCSYVPEIVESLKCDLQTVRFLKLGPGSEIRRHRDYELGPEDGFIRVHIPAITNDKVTFTLDDQPLSLSAGEVWFLNVNKYHSVKNGGTTERVHLVIDCVMNEWVSAFLNP